MKSKKFQVEVIKCSMCGKQFLHDEPNSVYARITVDLIVGNKPTWPVSFDTCPGCMIDFRNSHFPFEIDK